MLLCDVSHILLMPIFLSFSYCVNHNQCNNLCLPNQSITHLDKMCLREMKADILSGVKAPEQTL